MSSESANEGASAPNPSPDIPSYAWVADPEMPAADKQYWPWSDILTLSRRLEAYERSLNEATDRSNSEDDQKKQRVYYTSVMKEGYVEGMNCVAPFCREKWATKIKAGGNHSILTKYNVEFVSCTCQKHWSIDFITKNPSFATSFGCLPLTDCISHIWRDHYSVRKSPAKGFAESMSQLRNAPLPIPIREGEMELDLNSTYRDFWTEQKELAVKSGIPEANLKLYDGEIDYWTKGYENAQGKVSEKAGSLYFPKPGYAFGIEFQRLSSSDLPSTVQTDSAPANDQ